MSTGKGILRNKEGKEILRAGYGYKEGKRMLRAGFAGLINIFDSTPSLNKLWNIEVLSEWT